MADQIPSSDVVLRQATSLDADFAYRVLDDSMRAYAVATWGDWPEARAREEARSDAASGRSQVILLDAVPVGIVRVDRHPTHLQLEQLFLLSAHRNRGIGARVLDRVLAEAMESRLPVRLRVLRVNPARSFYERHGFEVVSETPERYFMERTP